MLFFRGGTVDRMRARLLWSVCMAHFGSPQSMNYDNEQGFIITGRRFREPKFTDMVSLHSTHYTPFPPPTRYGLLARLFSVSASHVNIYE
jgi:hypothetical protein